MSLSYKEMYDITAGIHVSFNKKILKRQLKIRHSNEKRESLRILFPLRTYETWTRENFIIANLYINFIKGSSSLVGCMEHLRELEEKEVFSFKNDIINYRRFLKEDIKRIKIEEGSNPGLDYMIKEYRNSKIKWFTFYFYVMSSDNALDIIQSSRVNNYLFKKIKRLLLYVSFSEKSMLLVKEIITNEISLN